MRDRQQVRFCSSSDGVRLAYATIGTGAPLVKAANWLSHLEYDWQSPIWHHWIEALARDHRYIRYDARGCGLSDRAPGEISFKASVRDLEAVVDANGLERFPLLGISQGGAIAISYAVRHPERVSHLVLYGSYARGRLRRTDDPKKHEEAMLYYKLVQHGWGTDNVAFRQVFTSQFLPGASAELQFDFDELQRVSATGDDAVRIMQANDQIDIGAVAAQVRCPTLVMHARGDRRMPFEEGYRLATAIPGAQFVPLQSDNHILLKDEPAWGRFVLELRDFLRAGDDRAAAIPGLTARDQELLEYLARGLDNHQIAAHLELSEKTVRNRVSAILDKLGVETRAAAIVKARNAGFGVEPSSRG